MDVDDLPPTYEDLYDNNKKEAADDDNLPCYEVAIEMGACHQNTEVEKDSEDSTTFCEDKAAAEWTSENKIEADRD